VLQRQAIARSPFIAALAMLSLSLSACGQRHGHLESEHHTIVTTSPAVRDVVITEQYVCQIHSRRHIEVRALQEGYLEPITIQEGQEVKKDDVLFKVVPAIYKANLDAEMAEAQFARLEYNNTKRLFESKTPVVSIQEVALYQAKFAKAEAKAKLAEAEFHFTEIKAPFDGIIDRLEQQQGSLVKKEDVLTTLSDNSVMWVYFNVPEARYLEYMADQSQSHPAGGVPAGGKVAGNSLADDFFAVEGPAENALADEADESEAAEDQGSDKRPIASSESPQIELVLANGRKFNQTGTIGAIEAQFNNETGNIPFRADFPNPDRLLRHGQTGNVLIHRTLNGAIVIPQRATFEILDKRFVFVAGKDGIVHQREISVQQELDDIFVVDRGLAASDKIVLEGVRQVRDGEKLEDVEFRKPEDALAHLKYHAE
jgi:membrane fusion protein (multidrug efflux system)